MASDKGYWFAAGLSAQAERLERDLRKGVARVADLDDSYRGERFERWRDAMLQAIGALRDGEAALRSRRGKEEG